MFKTKLTILLIKTMKTKIYLTFLYTFINFVEAGFSLKYKGIFKVSFLYFYVPV